MDESCEVYNHLYSALLGFYQPESLGDSDSTDVVPAFDPEPVIAHCFKQFKQDFRLPQSRRRVIIVPAQQGQAPVDPTPRPPPSLPPVSSLSSLDGGGEGGDIPGPLEDRAAWLHQRARLRKELEALGDVTQWLKNKPSISPLEAKVLRMLHKEREAQLMGQVTATVATKKGTPQRVVPQLRLPKPQALSALYSYLRSRKIQVLELFAKGQGMQQRVSREEFLSALRTVGVPLQQQEMEDVVIYLSSLGKQHEITIETLASTYKQWSVAQQRSILPTTCKSQSLASLQPRKKDLLTVPEVPMLSEARPLTLEEMEDVGKHYRERRRQLKLSIPSIEYTESCRLVRSGDRRVDSHCLPSTVAGEGQDLLDSERRDGFLLYLRCGRQCVASGLPVREDVLSRALLYPGDRIILQDTQVRPIRQPGGFYSDWKPMAPHLATHKMQGPRLGPHKSDKKAPQDSRRTPSKEAQEVTRKLKARRRGGIQRTHPNAFWPGHLLDKLRLCLPSKATDRSLALFSCVRQERHAYRATYHPDRWWPLQDKNYMTQAHYDSPKVYAIN